MDLKKASNYELLYILKSHADGDNENFTLEVQEEIYMRMEDKGFNPLFLYENNPRGLFKH